MWTTSLGWQRRRGRPYEGSGHRMKLRSTTSAAVLITGALLAGTGTAHADPAVPATPPIRGSSTRSRSSAPRSWPRCGARSSR
ncbi:hypothetical protein NSERUTF1_6612 [Nocardia seriolae]|nr:hypothetical protein NSERUTF1_6612 [Nocardia seriolae]